MSGRRATAVAVFGLGAWFLVGCKSEEKDNKTPDLAVPDAILSEGGPMREGLKPDLPAGKKPKITKMIPDSGLADGGASGRTPVTIVGENFVAGMSAFIDGQPLGTSVNVASPVSASFSMPKNPYGPPYDRPQKVSVGVLVGSQFSNTVDFQYTVTIPMTASFKGSVVTATSSGFRDFPSEPIEGKAVALGGGDAGAAPTIRAQVGLGTVGSDPTQDPSFMWFPATFNRKDGAYDVFSATVVPGLSKTYDVAYRFSIDGGGRWIYADTDETDLKYDPAKAAKLTATDPPPGFCLTSNDCLGKDRYKVTCKVDTADKTKNVCVECLKDADCAGYPKALGPKCDATGLICQCGGDPDCATNMNGAVCIPDGSYCGCQSETNCPPPSKCTEDQKTGMTTCL